jgi:ABC-type nitrate/sulfonate/bicarbonate transport system substrate-binding protein
VIGCTGQPAPAAPTSVPPGSPTAPPPAAPTPATTPAAATPPTTPAAATPDRAGGADRRPGPPPGEGRLGGQDRRLWPIAHDAGYFTSNGVEVDLQFISSSTIAVPALLAGDIGLAAMAGSAVVSAQAGGSDIVMFAGL